jgi:hypothetical protein
VALIRLGIMTGVYACAQKVFALSGAAAKSQETHVAPRVPVLAAHDA